MLMALMLLLGCSGPLVIRSSIVVAQLSEGSRDAARSSRLLYHGICVTYLEILSVTRLNYRQAHRPARGRRGARVRSSKA